MNGLPGSTAGEAVAQSLLLHCVDTVFGVLAAGTRIETDRRSLVADGSEAYSIRASGPSSALDGRRRIRPPGDSQPQIVYLGEKSGEEELLDALRSGRIDAIARGEADNLGAAAKTGGALAVSALDAATEHGGFALAAKDAALAACLDRKVAGLTDYGKIGYREWREDTSVFMRRARAWPAETNR